MTQVYISREQLIQAWKIEGLSENTAFTDFVTALAERIGDKEVTSANFVLSYRLAQYDTLGENYITVVPTLDLWVPGILEGVTDSQEFINEVSEAINPSENSEPKKELHNNENKKV